VNRPRASSSLFPPWEQAFGAIAVYLANRNLIGSYFQPGSAKFARLREEAMRQNPAICAKLQAAKLGR
jgi:hypothetical protein